MADKPSTVTEYVDGLSPHAQCRILELRALISANAPQLDEHLKWGAPAYVHPDGVIMLMTSAHKQHANIVFTPSTREAFVSELAAYATGKGSVKLGYEEAVPADLLAQIIRYRLREYEDHGIKWM